MWTHVNLRELFKRLWTFYRPMRTFVDLYDSVHLEIHYRSNVSSHGDFLNVFLIQLPHPLGISRFGWRLYVKPQPGNSIRICLAHRVIIPNVKTGTFLARKYCATYLKWPLFRCVIDSVNFNIFSWFLVKSAYSELYYSIWTKLEPLENQWIQSKVLV